jgi:NAD-dependent SIR2 family protein deacetylase
VTRVLDDAGGLAPGALPDHRDGPADALGGLADLVAGGQVVLLSGAGLSTESGIPDYRGPSGLARRAEPMTYQAFTGSAAGRQRYWARSHLGWRHIARAAPNAGHHAVAELERRGLLAGIITQNVDGLHQAAGAQRVIELHGSLHRVACLGCGRRTSRAELSRRMRAANPGWDAAVTEINPDGDAALTGEQAARFHVVDCESCGGWLKPDVVFFGENVPRPRVDECYALAECASALVVLGSSLTVMSGYRFVRRVAKLGSPVVIVNQGPTRGDSQALLTLDAPLGRTLTALVSRLDTCRPGSLGGSSENGDHEWRGSAADANLGAFLEAAEQ